MLTTVDGFVKRVADGFYTTEPFFREYRIAPGQALWNGLFGPNVIWKYTVPSMPSGVSAFIPIKLDIQIGNVPGQFVFGRVFDMGSLDIASNVFTDGGAFPTVTELGVSSQMCGPVFVEVTTALNSTPGSLTVTYVDQDGNAAQVGLASAMSASCAVGVGGFAQLASGDYAARDVTSAARSGGTTPTGVLAFSGFIPIGQSTGGTTAQWLSMSLLGAELNPVRLAAGDVLALLDFAVAAKGRVCQLTMVGDTP